MLRPEQVSCVIPYAGAQAYPRAREHLFAAVESALLQQFGEVILSYDGPESEPLAGFSRADHVRIVRQPARVGPAAARNAGIRACLNTHVVLLDQDDILCPGYLPAMLSWVAQHQLRCAAATLFYIGENPKRVGSVVSRHPDFFLPSGFFSEVALISEAGYFPDTVSEDLFFFLSIRKIVQLTTCPAARALYRIHPQASSGNMLTAWAIINLLPEYRAGALTLAELNIIGKAYATHGTIPPGLNRYFHGSDSVTARFLARNAYACWLNRDLIGIAGYGVRLLFHLPKLSHMARYKWSHAHPT